MISPEASGRKAEVLVVGGLRLNPTAPMVGDDALWRLPAARDTLPGMSTLALLIVLAVCALAVIGGLAYFGLRAYRLVRTGMRVARDNGARATIVADKAASAQAKAAALAEGGGRLGQGASGLQSTLARLSILTSALAEARAPWQGLARFLRQK
jgi:hypothetical protein